MPAASRWDLRSIRRPCSSSTAATGSCRSAACSGRFAATCSTRTSPQGHRPYVAAPSARRTGSATAPCSYDRAAVPFPCPAHGARRGGGHTGGAGALASDADGAPALGAAPRTLSAQSSVATSQGSALPLHQGAMVQGCSNHLVDAPILSKALI